MIEKELHIGMEVEVEDVALPPAQLKAQVVELHESGYVSLDVHCPRCGYWHKRIVKPADLRRPEGEVPG